MAELDLIYEMTELALISKAADTLKGIDITYFMTSYGYCDYFKASNSIGVLKSRGLIYENPTDCFGITDKGLSTLHSLHDRITPGMEDDFRDFYKDRKENGTVTALYETLSGGRGYQVHLSLKQNGLVILSIDTHVATRDKAEKMCANFREHYLELYGSCMDTLMS